MKSNKYDKQLLIIGLAISLSLAGLLLSVKLNKLRWEKIKNNSPQIIEQTMFLRSKDFQHNAIIPAKFTCDGLDVNPNLIISGIPKETISLTIIMNDPDATNGDWSHWIAWNIPPQINKILTNTIPKGTIVGINDFDKNEYGGPCPLQGTHRYIFTLYALDTDLSLDTNTHKKQLLESMEGHVIKSVELIGLYSR